MSQSKALKEIKIILNFDLDDDREDQLLLIYINRAINFIYSYTNLKEIPVVMDSLIVEMAIFEYRQRDLENVSSESIGAMSYTFTTEYPEKIMKQLDSYKKVTIV